jgi:alcohol dehydrogenase
MGFEFSSPTRLIFGEGVFARLGEQAARFGKKALLVTGRRALLDSGHVSRAEELLAAAGVACVLYNQIPPNPTIEIIDAGAELARAAGCDLVIGLGGGSSMDSAKALAIATAHGRPIRMFMEAAGADRLTPGPQTLPVICVPSTAGTSSELTPFAVLTIPETCEKAAIRSEYIQARVALSDPELTYSAPPAVTAATGIDVLCHALEAYVSENAQPITDLMACEAVRLVGQYLPRIYRDGSDIEGRRMLLLSNTYAGYGLANCGATIMHGMEHPVSGHYPQVAHGAGLAAMIPAWATLLEQRVPEKFARIAVLLGAADSSMEVNKAAALAAPALHALLQTVGLDQRLRNLGVAEELLEKMAADTCRYMGATLPRTPGGLTPEDVLALLQAAY